jgi:hypothetical protein
MIKNFLMMVIAAMMFGNIMVMGCSGDDPTIPPQCSESFTCGIEALDCCVEVGPECSRGIPQVFEGDSLTLTGFLTPTTDNIVIVHFDRALKGYSFFPAQNGMEIPFTLEFSCVEDAWTVHTVIGDLWEETQTVEISPCGSLELETLVTLGSPASQIVFSQTCSS